MRLLRPHAGLVLGSIFGGAVIGVPSVPTLTTAGAKFIANYDASSASALTLVQATARGNATPATDADHNRLTALKNSQTATGSLPDLTRLLTGLYGTNGPVWYPGVLPGGTGGFSCFWDEKGIAGPTAGSVDMTQPITLVDIFAMTTGASAVNNGEIYIGVVSNHGSQLLAFSTTATYPTGAAAGQLYLKDNSNNYQPISSGSMAGTRCVVVRRFLPAGAAALEGQQPGTMRTWVNGTLWPTDIGYNGATTADQIALGNTTSGGQFDDNCFDGWYQQHLIANAAVSSADAAAIYAWAKQKYGDVFGKTPLVPVLSMLAGQSNAMGMSGQQPGQAPLDYQGTGPATRDVVAAQLTGSWMCVDVALRGLSTPIVASTALLESNNGWSSSTQLNTNPTSLFIDTASDDPTAWTENMNAGLGPSFWNAISKAKDPTHLQVIAWRQGENDMSGMMSSTANRLVAGQSTVGNTFQQNIIRYTQGLQQLVTRCRASLGNPNLALGIFHLGAGYNWMGDLFRAAMMRWCDDNPSMGFMLDMNPWQYFVLDSTSPPHETNAAYRAASIVRARREAAYFLQRGLVSKGPSYSGFPAIASIAVTAGNRFVDVTFTNPNGAGSLIISADQPTLGWEVWQAGQTYGGAAFGGTTTTTIGAWPYELTGYESAGAPAGETITGVTLLSPFTLRLAIGNALKSGQKLTVFYGRENANRNTFATGVGIVGNMLQDNAATTCPVESGLSAAYRINMPARICPEGISVTVA